MNSVGSGGSMGSKGLILIAGGGTGGHIYPGLAIAEKLTDLGFRVEWVGATSGLEKQIVTQAGVPLHLISVGKLHRSVGRLQQLKTVLGLPLALLRALLLALRLRPRAILGVGGFASGPMAFAARLLGTRLVIWEPNAHMGLANRILSRFADRVLVVFPEASKQASSNVIPSGLPVRRSIQKKSFRQSSEIKKGMRVLVFGGSQGARAINRAMMGLVETFGSELLGRIELMHQTGKADYAEVDQFYRDWLQKFPQYQGRLKWADYLHRIEEQFAWADLLLCRSGASTVAEVCAAGLPALFVPLPTAADNHQLKNALSLVQKDAALLIEQGDLTPGALSRALGELADEPDRLSVLAGNAHRLFVRDAVDTIAREVQLTAEVN